MRSFACDERGDVRLENGEIVFAEGDTLLCQKVRCLTASARGEWWLNEEEGMDRRVLMEKRPDEGRVRDEVGRALLALGEELVLTEFSMQMEGRTLCLDFTAETAAGRARVAAAL